MASLPPARTVKGRGGWVGKQTLEESTPSPGGGASLSQCVPRREGDSGGPGVGDPRRNGCPILLRKLVAAKQDGGLVALSALWSRRAPLGHYQGGHLGEARRL